MRTTLIIPSLGGPHLTDCLRSAAALEPPPEDVLLVLSGGAAPPQEAGRFRNLRYADRLGFTAAVNHGLDNLRKGTEAVAVLNDDALPDPGWLESLTSVLERRPGVGAVQGTVVTADRSSIDGRGIELDRWALPVQVDRGREFTSDYGERRLVAVSGTACVYRLRDLRRIALKTSEVFDESFDSYHEDLDLGLRLLRSGSKALWTGGAPVRHLGSASGGAYVWRHPWWLLANRWRALAGNLTPGALLRNLPRVLRGELRALNTLVRTNPRAVPVAVAEIASLPWLILRGWQRSSPGPRLSALPGTPS